MKLTDLQTMVAKRINNSIKEQECFIKRQKEAVQNCLLGQNPNQWDLRQNISCLYTAETALELLHKTFVENIGVTHAEWVKATTKPKEESDETQFAKLVKKIIAKV